MPDKSNASGFNSLTWFLSLTVLRLSGGSALPGNVAGRGINKQHGGLSTMGIKRSTDATKQGWLTLARKINEPLFLTMPDGTQVEMRIVDVRGNTVRTSWLAPKSVKIFRHDAKQATDDSKEGQTA